MKNRISTSIAVSVAENVIDYCYGTDIESVQRAMTGITVSITDSKAVYDNTSGRIYIKECVVVYDVSKDSITEACLSAY